MLYVETPRWKFIEHLPKGGRVLEIGVLRGDWSAKLLHVLKPKELHLVDPWIYHDNDDEYKSDLANKPQNVQEDNYQIVCNRFSEEIKEGSVVLHRKKSLEATGQFPDEYFDLIYIDAMHYHSAVLADLKAFASKIRKGGILAGHDFCEHQPAANMNFGVVTAVTSFIKISSFRCIFLTGQEESYPSYFLCNEERPDWLKTVTSSLIAKGVPFLELPDALLGNFHHVQYREEGCPSIYVPSFA